MQISSAVMKKQTKIVELYMQSCWEKSWQKSW